MEKVGIIEEGLRGIELPALVRSAVGPGEPATEALARWAITYCVYSCIAHVRTILSAMVGLHRVRNVAANYVLSRHLYEWTAHACYLRQKMPPLFDSGDWNGVFALFEKAVSGNRWAKEFGHRYEKEWRPAEIADMPEPILIPALIKAYARYQKELECTPDAHDAYALLSEQSHPNGTALNRYREISGSEVRFVTPMEDSSLGGVDRFMIDWLIFTQQLLAIASESAVNRQLFQIVEMLLKSA